MYVWQCIAVFAEEFCESRRHAFISLQAFLTHTVHQGLPVSGKVTDTQRDLSHVLWPSKYYKILQGHISHAPALESGR